VNSTLHPKVFEQSFARLITNVLNY